MDGNTNWYEPVSVQAVGTKGSLTVIPNPFSTSTKIYPAGMGYRAKDIKLEVYDISGRKVREISLLPFNFSLGITWDGRDDYGKHASPGIYFVRLRSGDYTASKKVLLVR
jgi:hypothetical protein